MNRRASQLKAADVRGLIFHVQRYSLHDGPGIRTTVFLKGCPLRCRWCSNPEGISSIQELMVSDHRCNSCFRCLPVCTSGAITKEREKRVIDRNKCTLCFACVAACPYGALEVAGKFHSIGEIVEEIEKDRLFFANSNGGVTFSGGEPALQAPFVREVFRLCRQRAIHTALDTAGCVSWPRLREILDFTDLVLYDIKHLHPGVHKGWTGKANQLILSNFKKTARLVRTWVRVPIVPDFNDSADFITELSRWITDLGETKIEKVSLLPYHSWGVQKYDKLGLDYRMPSAMRERSAGLDELRTIVESLGMNASIGR